MSEPGTGERRREPRSRRRFLRDGLRNLVFGGLLLTGGALGWRTVAGGARSAGCPETLPCRRCRRLLECDAPRAAAARSFSRPEAARPDGAPSRKGTEDRLGRE
jgi:hypothetical protein